jgi:hypothetical protein
MTHLSKTSIFWLLNRAALLGICLLVAGAAMAQSTRKGHSADDEPIFLDYRGIQIGWMADEVRKKLGMPADKGEEQDFFIFGEKETCQILYDKATHKVTAISVDFMSGASSVITPEQVFGSDFETKPDGSKYKLVRYPKAGYWVSYSRTAGDTPIVTITMQKLQALTPR